MSLVNAYKVDWGELPNVIHEICKEALRSDEKKLNLVLLDHSEHPVSLISVQKRTYTSCWQVIGQMLELVKHQGDQWTHHNCQSLQDN